MERGGKPLLVFQIGMETWVGLDGWMRRELSYQQQSEGDGKVNEGGPSKGEKCNSIDPNSNSKKGKQASIYPGEDPTSKKNIRR